MLTSIVAEAVHYEIEILVIGVGLLFGIVLVPFVGQQKQLNKLRAAKLLIGIGLPVSIVGAYLVFDKNVDALDISSWIIGGSCLVVGVWMRSPKELPAIMLVLCPVALAVGYFVHI